MQALDFQKEYLLENEVVKLRPLQLDDLENLKNFALEEPEIWKYSLQPANGVDNMTNYLHAALRTRKEKTAYPFLVFDKRSQKYAGSTRFYDIQLQQKTLQIGYTWYGNEFQGTGINKHCKFLLLQFAFETIGMERVEFRADSKNDRSIAAMKSIGCKVEGILRSHSIALYGRRDTIVLSILKNEWFDGVKETLQSKIEEERKRLL